MFPFILIFVVKGSEPDVDISKKVSLDCSIINSNLSLISGNCLSNKPSRVSILSGTPPSFPPSLPSSSSLRTKKRVKPTTIAAKRILTTIVIITIFLVQKVDFGPSSIDFTVSLF